MKVTRNQLAGLSPAEAATLWQVQRDQGAPVEAGLFEEWLALSPANREAWAKVDKAWALFDAADDPMFAALRANALSFEPEAPERSRFGVKWLGAAAAAMALVVTGSLAVLHGPWHQDQGTAQPEPSVAWQTYAAPVGSTSIVTLPDGTRMSLQGNTQVRIALAADRRQAVVDRGRVMFSVAHDAARPFAVQALDRRIVDIGTRFEVGLADQTLHVKLFEGSVRVDGVGAALVLKPGEQLAARTGQPARVEAMASAGPATQELVTFDNVTLARAAETINDGSRIKLVIADPQVAQLRLSGRFRQGDADRFARTAADLLSLRVVRIAPGRIELRRAR